MDIGFSVAFQTLIGMPWYAMVCPPEVSARSSALLHEVGQFFYFEEFRHEEFHGEKDALFFSINFL